jgi:hypothetical protein
VNTKTKKLEALCKELQKQNKAVIEESKLATEQEQVRAAQIMHACITCAPYLQGNNDIEIQRQSLCFGRF